MHAEGTGSSNSKNAPVCEEKLSPKPTKHWEKRETHKAVSFWGGLSEGKPRAEGLPWSLPTEQRSCRKRWTQLVMEGEGDLRGAIRDESQDVAHVHRVGLQVGVG